MPERCNLLLKIINYPISNAANHSNAINKAYTKVPEYSALL